MKTIRIVTAIAAAMLVAGSALAAPPGPTLAGAEAFLRHLYAPYVAGDSKFDPTGDPASQIFDAHLLALIRKDQAASRGEVGALDGDPICDCQDFDRLRGLAIALRADGPGRAFAQVRFVNEGQPDALTYRLTMTRAGWRVSDIGDKDMPSLAGLLMQTYGRK